MVLQMVSIASLVDAAHFDVDKKAIPPVKSKKMQPFLKNNHLFSILLSASTPCC